MGIFTDMYSFKPPIDILTTDDVVLTEQITALANVFGIKAICVTNEAEKQALKLNEVGIDYVNDCFYILNPNTEKIETRASFGDILTPGTGGGGTGGIQIDDNVISMYKTWSSRKIDAEDSALRTTIDAFSIIVNNVASDLIKMSTKVDNHANGSFTTFNGMHGFRFYNNALQYFYNNKWYNIPTSGGGTGGGATIDDNAINPNQTWSSEKISTEDNSIRSTIIGHTALKLVSPDGMHGIRLNNNKLQYFDDHTSSWVDIKTSGDVIDDNTVSTIKAWSSTKTKAEDAVTRSLVDTHGVSKVMTEDGIHGIRYINGSLQCYNGTRWIVIPIVGATIDDTVIAADKVWSSSRTSANISEVNAALTAHISKIILSENGLHGIRYYNGSLGVFNDNTWVDLKSAVIDDANVSNTTVWSSTKAKAEDDAIKTALSNVGTESNAHIISQLTTSDGVHGIRYFNAKLQYFSDGTWHDIATGGGSGGAQIDDTTISTNTVWSSSKTNTQITATDDKLNMHVTNAITSEAGLHNIRYYNSKLSVFTGAAWVEITSGGSGGATIDDTKVSASTTWSSSKISSEDTAIKTTVSNHTGAKVTLEEGSHGFRFFSNKLQYHNGTTWVDIPTGGAVIDDAAISVSKVWSSSKTKAEDDAIKTSVTAVDGKVGTLTTTTNTHIAGQFFSAEGNHGMRYYNSKLQYYNAGIWNDVPVSGVVIDDVTAATTKVWSSSKTKAEDDAIKTSVTAVDGRVTAVSNTSAAHIAGQFFSADGIHGLRFFESHLQYYSGGNWIEIPTGGAQIDDGAPSTTRVWSSSKTNTEVGKLTGHITQKILSVDGLHGIRYYNAILAVHDGSTWVDMPSVPGAVIDDPNILTTKTWSSSKIASEDSAVKRRVDDFDGILTTHVTTQVNTDLGMHGFRFFNNDLQYQNPETKEWVVIPTGGSQIDDGAPVANRVWSSAKANTQDEAIKTTLTTHTGTKVTVTEGAHGIRYNASKIQYNDGTNWQDVAVGAPINDTTPSATTTFSGNKINTHINDTSGHIGTGTKAAPVDADSLVLIDSADSGKSKRVLWSAIKSAFTAVFAPIVHSHAWADITGKPTPTVANVTIAAASWTGASAPFSYTYPNAAITTTNIIEFTTPASPTAAKLDAILKANIHGGTQATGSIVLLAYGEKPTIDVDVTFIINP